MANDAETTAVLADAFKNHVTALFNNLCIGVEDAEPAAYNRFMKGYRNAKACRDGAMERIAADV